MKILHIAKITNNSFNGVCVVVPQHMMAQSNFADVSFFNINREIISALEGNYKIKQIDCLEGNLNDIDLVIFHEAYVVQYLWIFVKLLKQSIPYVIIPHGELTIEAQKKKWLKKKVANVLLFNWFINSSLAIQCLSENELKGTNFKTKKFIVTNGISLPMKKKNEFNNFKIVFLYIGRLDIYHKGIDIMLEAISMKADFLRKNNCFFKIYGPDILGRLQQVEELIKRLKLGDLVSLNGAISGLEKEEKIIAADIFIQTSRFEGMPMGILEALSYGVPCLVTDGTTLGGFIKNADAGWVAETSVDSVAESIEKAVLDREKYHNFSQNGIKLVSENFCWDRIADSTVEKYRNLVMERRNLDGCE